MYMKSSSQMQKYFAHKNLLRLIEPGRETASGLNHHTDSEVACYSRLEERESVQSTHHSEYTCVSGSHCWWCFYCGADQGHRIELCAPWYSLRRSLRYKAGKC